MKLICRGYNTCLERNECFHSKSHNMINPCSTSIETDYPDCECVNFKKITRKEKLEKINVKNLQKL